MGFDNKRLLIFVWCRPNDDLSIKVNAFNAQTTMPEDIGVLSSTVSSPPINGMAGVQTTALKSGKSNKTFLEEQGSPTSNPASEASTQGYVTILYKENKMHM